LCRGRRRESGRRKSGGALDRDCLAACTGWVGAGPAGRRRGGTSRLDVRFDAASVGGVIANRRRRLVFDKTAIRCARARKERLSPTGEIKLT
jgi:hypothetical protein